MPNRFDNPNQPQPDLSLPSFASRALDDAAPETENAPTLAHIGRYALKRSLGRGGLGTVFEAWDPLLSRAVAVKRLQFDADTPARVSLDAVFLNEARTVAHLNHAHIVKVLDAGVSTDGVYIAMELLHGRDLRQALADGWRATPPAAAELARRIADALAYAHAHGVVHGDIKPSNLFLSRDGRPTLLDFGIARAAQAAALPTTERTVADSPHYLAPEQLAGGAVDGRTDVYALGVVLHELLSGRKAFDGATPEAVAHAVLHQEPAPADTGLAAIAARAMARDPDARYSTAAELSLALRQWIDEHAGESKRQARRAAAPIAARSPGRLRMPLALAALAVAGVAVALFAGRGGDDTPPIAQATRVEVPHAQPPATSSDTLTVASTGAPTPAEERALALADALAPTSDMPPAAQTETLPAPAAAAAAPANVAPPGVDPPARVAPPGVKRAVGSADAAPLHPPRSRAERERSSKVRVAPAATTRDRRAAASVPSGTLRMAITPWGRVEVDGRTVGTTPPLSSLKLPAGSHRITVRNGVHPPFATVVRVDADKATFVRHRFGR